MLNFVANGFFNFVNEIFTNIILFDINIELIVVINLLHLIIKQFFISKLQLMSIFNLKGHLCLKNSICINLKDLNNANHVICFH